MYAVKRNGKFIKFFGTHPNYETARSAVRKYIRANQESLSVQMEERTKEKHNHPFWNFFDGEFLYSNPALSSYDFRIVRV